MADYLMDITYYYPYKAYDIIRDIIGIIWARKHKQMNMVKITNSLYFSIRDFNINPYLKVNEKNRKLSLQEFKKYTVELFKESIYDSMSIKNAIEEREEFYFDTNINIEIQDIEILNLDNLYQVITNVFEWIYIKKISLENIECLEIIKKLDELLEKYEKDV